MSCTDLFSQVSHLSTGTFYNGVHASDIEGPDANTKDSVHHWCKHGFCGRGILLDYHTYAEQNNMTYNPYEPDRIPLSSIAACSKAQGIDIRPESQGGDMKIGDILFIRSGFTAVYDKKSSKDNDKAATRPHNIGPDDGQRWGGVEQSEEMLDWLHDCYFAAVAGDAPAFEAWPSNKEYYLHEYLLAMWGCPIGELLDLEELAKKCREQKRWTFFVASSPANVPGDSFNRRLFQRPMLTVA